VRFPRGALEASEAHESHRERLCHRAAPAAGDEGRGLEDARARLRLQTAGHGEPALAQARRRPAPPPGASRGEVHGWHHAGAARSRRAEGRRLINPRSTTFDNSSHSLRRTSQNFADLRRTSQIFAELRRTSQNLAEPRRTGGFVPGHEDAGDPARYRSEDAADGRSATGRPRLDVIPIEAPEPILARLSARFTVRLVEPSSTPSHAPCLLPVALALA